MADSVSRFRALVHSKLFLHLWVCAAGTELAAVAALVGSQLPLVPGAHTAPLLSLLIINDIMMYEMCNLCNKQGRKRPLDTPKRMIKRREGERKVEGKI